MTYGILNAPLNHVIIGNYYVDGDGHRDSGPIIIYEPCDTGHYRIYHSDCFENEISDVDSELLSWSYLSDYFSNSGVEGIAEYFYPEEETDDILESANELFSNKFISYDYGVRSEIVKINNKYYIGNIYDNYIDACEVARKIAGTVTRAHIGDSFVVVTGSGSSIPNSEYDEDDEWSISEQGEQYREKTFSDFSQASEVAKQYAASIKRSSDGDGFVVTRDTDVSVESQAYDAEDYNDYEPDNSEYEDTYQKEIDRENEELMQDIREENFEYSENAARGEENGWFYDDEHLD